MGDTQGGLPGRPLQALDKSLKRAWNGGAHAAATEQILERPDEYRSNVQSRNGRTQCC